MRTNKIGKNGICQLYIGVYTESDEQSVYCTVNAAATYCGKLDNYRELRAIISSSRSRTRTEQSLFVAVYTANSFALVANIYE